MPLPLDTSDTTGLDWTCPVCGDEPAEPVRLEEQFWCTNHVDHCETCGGPAVPGEPACTLCRRVARIPEATLPHNQLRRAS
ncbi:Uncharacterised protein [Mycobacteroides abscessus subsp. massiliense]|nr:Uncharacterised protein [Mycobacteroides abscessus subsp. massiliense]SKU13290.1 Uncharacterised protein [Mycobacteroides abscessus subsp. massiliense]